MNPLPPGATIGILGGGQLGRMLAAAAAQLGYRTVVLAPEDNPPAAQTASAVIKAGYEEMDALDLLAAQSDVVTYEFENVPAAAAARLAGKVPVRPGPRALEVTQDRLLEKDFLSAIEIGTAPYRAVASLEDLEQAVQALGLPAVLKTRRFGYDGKGQAMLRRTEDLAPAFEALGGGALILEGFIDFEREVSILAARGLDGDIRVYPLVHNTHKDHILDISRVPAGVSSDIEAEACRMAQDIAEALDYVGVLAVEMFVTRDGQLLVNELAPRVHNSGHWTMEGAVISQFENHIRAIAGLPLGDTQALGLVEMRNLIGKDVDAFAGLLKDGSAHVHLYGKREARPGRKMGHVTWVKPK